MSETDALAKRYILLVLSLAEHNADYLDTYYGPESFREEAKQRGKVDLKTLLTEAGELLSDIRGNDQLETERKEFLLAQVRAVETTIRMQLGERMSVAEKVENIFGFTPERVDESEVEEGNRLLDDVLPGEGSITERLQAYHDSMIIPVENLESLCNFVLDELRERTRQRFGLPEGESIELHLVNDRPFGGACYFKGEGRSVVEINTDLPHYLNYLTVFMAHEFYPGHHTEYCLKETYLIQEQGRQELWVVPSIAPQVFLAEMIATHAREMIMPDDELEDWFRDQLLPRSRLKVADPGMPSQVEKAQRMLAPVRLNAVFKHWDDGAGEGEIKEYFKKYRHEKEEEAAHSARWVMDPVFHVYTFTYYPSYQVLKGVLARSGNPHQVFGRLLKEAHLPATIQSW